jgi:hypothetical protein
MDAFAAVAFPPCDIDVFHTDYAAESAKPQSTALPPVDALTVLPFAT